MLPTSSGCGCFYLYAFPPFALVVTEPSSERSHKGFCHAVEKKYGASVVLMEIVAVED